MDHPAPIILPVVSSSLAAHDVGSAESGVGPDSAGSGRLSTRAYATVVLCVSGAVLWMGVFFYARRRRSRPSSGLPAHTLFNREH